MITSLPGAYAAARSTRGSDQPHEITAAVYDEALGVVPPIRGAKNGGFWVGEPDSHDSKGREVSLECWSDGKGQRFYCRLSVVEVRQ